MAVVYGESFLALKKGTAVVATNLFNKELSEIVYFPRQSSSTKAERISISAADEENLAIILSKSCSLQFGGEAGANEKNVSVILTFVENKSAKNEILATDFVRLGLERGETALKTLNTITSLIEEYVSSDSALKACFIICDSNDAWLLNMVSSLWAAENITEGCRSVGKGLSIGEKIDKQCDSLQEKAKILGEWDGKGNFDFCKVFSGKNVNQQKPWAAIEDAFEVIKMFECLRQAPDAVNAQNSQVSILNSQGISNHWFTGTSKPQESVFKPFVFTPNAKISPLTKAADCGETVLNKLHENRNWMAIGNLLQSLEKSCVEEVKNYLLDHSGVATQELDELMKDCVEAEVKFYR